DRNYFEYVSPNANEYDIDNPSLDNDSISFVSESLVSESTIIDDSDRDCEIEMQPFTWDKIGFEKAYAIADANEYEEFSWENAEIEDKNIDSASIFEQESEESTEE
ncbi:4196_t:CDS:1, partial [Ambispora gerdemannii]